METGSELLLSKDGGFRYYLVYGALDMFAEGDWSQKEDRVLLVTRRKQSNDPEGALQPFERLEMRMIPPPADGKAVLETELWGRTVTYVRHGDADAGDLDARRESVETSRACLSADNPHASPPLHGAAARKSGL